MNNITELKKMQEAIKVSCINKETITIETSANKSYGFGRDLSWHILVAAQKVVEEDIARLEHAKAMINELI